MTTTRHLIVLGDARSLQELADRSVHLVVTSPPYWQLKDYGDERQIGFDDSYERYINNLNLVWQECERVLQPGCRLCVNIGDQFARSVYYGRYKVIPIRTEIIKFCESAGFDYMGAIIWQKVTSCNTSGGATIMGSFPYPRNGILKLDYEFILILKKHGKPPRPEAGTKEASRLTVEEWNDYFAGHWKFPGEKQDGHLAMFPAELPRRLIRMFSFVGDTVLDPFLGSGTTALAAMRLGRNSAGFEVNRDFLPVIRSKLGLDGLFPPSGSAVELVLRGEQGPPDFEARLAALPYVFRDPLPIERRGDKRDARFGSKVDGRERPEERFYGVKDIMTPDEVLLDSGQRVRLLGVKARPETAEAAMVFLRKRTRSSKVYLRHDKIVSEDPSSPRVYVYLKNRTFLNKHLIRTGLVEVDTDFEYRWRERFLRERK